MLSDLRFPVVDPANDHAVERILCGVVILAHGDLDRLDEAAQLACADWRDVLVASGLADEDWPAKLDAELGV
ncbi:hypothetical protein [Amycolatopsis sp. GM8]|uniref:hypothetical protein n=1 Tax=Amycolatopsis sp. GM8 TaxID=2896530 RepID=UPI001F2ED2D5|nr:hypothetical protein [Amycolatopsis sp. GM8]